MASNEESGNEEFGTEGLQEDAFVEGLIHDPTQPAPPFGVFEGLLGKSPRRGYWRLYLDIELTRYLEFKEEDVLASATIPKKQSRLGLEGTKLWLKRDATITHTITKQKKVEEFFEVPESSIMPFGRIARAVARQIGEEGPVDNRASCDEILARDLGGCDIKHPEGNDDVDNFNKELRDACKDNARINYRLCKLGGGGSFGGGGYGVGYGV
jgi:hypothetical protein